MAPQQRVGVMPNPSSAGPDIAVGASDTETVPGEWITDQRLLVTVAIADPVWNFNGVAINFFRDAWADAPIPVIPSPTA